MNRLPATSRISLHFLVVSSGNVFLVSSSQHRSIIRGRNVSHTLVDIRYYNVVSITSRLNQRKSRVHNNIDCYVTVRPNATVVKYVFENVTRETFEPSYSRKNLHAMDTKTG